MSRPVNEVFLSQFCIIPLSGGSLLTRQLVRQALSQSAWKRSWSQEEPVSVWSCLHWARCSDWTHVGSSDLLTLSSFVLVSLPVKVLGSAIVTPTINTTHTEHLNVCSRQPHGVRTTSNDQSKRLLKRYLITNSESSTLSVTELVRSCRRSSWEEPVSVKMFEMSGMSKNPPLLCEAVRTEAEALVEHMLGHVTWHTRSLCWRVASSDLWLLASDIRYWLFYG